MICKGDSKLGVSVNYKSSTLIAKRKLLGVAFLLLVMWEVEGVKEWRFHICYLSMTLWFSEASQEQMTYLCWLLMWFEALSGLKINLEKSELILVGRVIKAELLVDELGYKVGSLSSTYLRMPLGAHFNFEAVWTGLKSVSERDRPYGRGSISLRRGGS